MSNNENRRVIAGAFAATALLAGLIFGTPVAQAAPDTGSGGAQIETGSGPRTAGAEHEDGSGVPGPSFDTPVSIPSAGSAPKKPGKDATEEELKAYEKAVAAYEQRVHDQSQAEALERARQIAKEYRECINAGRELC